MKFLGQCEVCGREIPTYRSLGQHLRHASDVAHDALRARWDAWRSEYRAQLRCRKCGELWGITDRAERDKKRCPRCEDLRRSMSGRQYEKLVFEKPPDPRQVMTASGSKAQWDGLSTRHFTWTPEDRTYQQVVQAVESGEHINPVRARLGISYKVFRAIAEHAFGTKRFSLLMRQRKVDAARRAVMQAQTSSGLEEQFSQSLTLAGIPVVARNAWVTLLVAGKKTHREADIKVALSGSRKLVVLCDGEAFHGPKALYVEPSVRIADDMATAEGFFSLGYSVIRYSESEIVRGEALGHLQSSLPALNQGSSLLRLWHPLEERWA